MDREPGRLQSTELQSVRHHWATEHDTFIHEPFNRHLSTLIFGFLNSINIHVLVHVFKCTFIKSFSGDILLGMELLGCRILWMLLYNKMTICETITFFLPVYKSFHALLLLTLLWDFLVFLQTSGCKMGYHCFNSCFSGY